MLPLQLSTYPYPLQGTPTKGTFTFDAAAKRFAFLFRAPKSGSLTRAGFVVGSVTGTSPELKVEIQGVSSKAPDGVANGSALVTPSGAALERPVLTSPPTVTAGDLLAMVLSVNSGTADGSNSCTIVSGISQFDLEWPLPMQDTGGGTFSDVGSLLPGYFVEIAGESFGYPASGVSSSVSLSGAGNRVAQKISLPAEIATVEFNQFYMASRLGDIETAKIGLWNASSKELAVRPRDQDGNATWEAREFSLPGNPGVVSTGTPSYLGFEVVSDTFTYDVIDFPDAIARAAWPGGEHMHLATYDGSTWADDTDRMFLMTAFLTAVTTPGGGGGGSTVHYPRRRKVR